MENKQAVDKLFIGKKKVLWYNKTEDGDIKFELDDGSSDTVTEPQFQVIAKTHRYEDGMVQVYKWNDAVSKIIAILLDNKMRLIEKDFVAGRVDATIIENYQKAAAKLFGAQFEEFINLAQIHTVLMENNMQDDVAVAEASDAGSEEVVAEEGASEEVSTPEVE